MPKFDHFADIVFGSSDPSTSRAINRAVRAGRLQKLAPRLYTSLEGAPDAIVRQYWTTIAGHFFPGAVISHRSAFRGASIAEGVLFLTGDQDRDLELPGLLIRSSRGPGPLLGDMPFANGLFVSSQARYLLENLQPSRARKTMARTVPIEEIEERLQQVCNIRGEGELNTLRDEARALAPQLGPEVAEREWPKLDALIGALLGTRPAGGLKTDAGRARAAGQPYDAARVARFERLAVALRQAVFPDRPFTDRGDAWVNAAFFDAYFSNYIEGTKFPPDVAARIVFRGEIIPKRTADS
ncbi:MAG TPA: cell filamentation protein Fic, partial [Gammaproteobacteria bacterium]|nr:cell filamentation protein Fic [Gammaproteobacteria bacterium]